MCAGVHVGHRVAQLAYPGTEPPGHSGGALRSEEEHEDAGEDEDLPDAEAEGHARECTDGSVTGPGEPGPVIAVRLLNPRSGRARPRRRPCCRSPVRA